MQLFKNIIENKTQLGHTFFACENTTHRMHVFIFQTACVEVQKSLFLSKPTVFRPYWRHDEVPILY